MTTIQIDRTDGLSSATAIKGPVRAATTANISLAGLQTIDGVVLAAEDRVLVKDQTTASENGIYVVDTGPWRRAKDFSNNRDVRKGTRVWVTDGALRAETDFLVTAENPIVIGTTNITFAAATAPIGDGAVGTTQLASGAVTRAKLASALSKSIGISVFEYGATGDNVTNDGAAFEAAQTAAIAAGSNLVIVPEGDYLINTQIDMAANVTWLMLGAKLRTSLDTMKIFSADTVDGWSILGRCELVGSLTTADEQPQIGLYVEDCDRYLVEGISARLLKGKGFHLTGSASVGLYRGDRGQFIGCSAFECTVGRQLDAGAGAEYTTWTNWHAAGNILADRIGAGNTTTAGGAIVDNVDGVELLSGSNHGHGIYSGVSINHNSGYNIHGIGCLNGFTFNGCHIYENDVFLEQCAGIWFRGGIFDARVYNDGSASSGDNGVTDAFLPGDYYDPPTINVTGGDDGSGLGKFVFDRCSGDGAIDSSGRSVNNLEPFLVFDSSSILAGSRGVTITRNGTGDYTLTFARPFPSAFYAVAVSALTNGSGHPLTHSIISQTTTALRIAFFTQNGATTTATDCTRSIVRASA